MILSLSTGLWGSRISSNSIFNFFQSGDGLERTGHDSNLGIVVTISATSTFA